MGSYGLAIGTNLIAAPNLYTAWSTLIPAMQARGLDLLRFQRRWRNIETSQGVYDWSVLDDAVAHCNANAIKIHFTIQGAPSWALVNPGMQSSQTPTYQMDPQLTAGFARAICTRYYPGSPNGFIDVLGWNEDFNITFASNGTLGIHASSYPEYNATVGGASINIQPDRDPYYAAQVIAAVHPVLRALAPTVPLGLPVIWWRQFPNTRDFIQGLYDVLGSQLNSWYDFADFHFYSKTNDPLTAGVGANHATSIAQFYGDMQTAMNANGAGQKTITLSEFGWQVPTDCSAAVQASRYQELLSSVVLSGAGGGPRITRVNVYTYDYMGNDTSSLVTSNGMGGWTYAAADSVLSAFIAQNPALVGRFGGFMAHA